MPAKIMDHTAYPKSLKGKNDDALRFIARDAYEAMMALPHGENAGYYADEVCYCTDELAKRLKDIKK